MGTMPLFQSHFHLSRSCDSAQHAVAVDHSIHMGTRPHIQSLLHIHTQTLLRSLHRRLDILGPPLLASSPSRQTRLHIVGCTRNRKTTLDFMAHRAHHGGHHMLQLFPIPPTSERRIALLHHCEHAHHPMFIHLPRHYTLRGIDVVVLVPMGHQVTSQRLYTG